MNCPTCGDRALRPRLTKQGVEVDFCDVCGGMWLDQGEIYYFTRQPLNIARSLNKGRREARVTSRLNPRTGKPLQEIPLGGQLRIDVCPETSGLWFDGGELEKLSEVDPGFLSVQFERKEPEPERQPFPAGQGPSPKPSRPVPLPASAPSLPNLFLCSAATLAGLYALLALILIAVAEYFRLPGWVPLAIGAAIALVQFILSPFLMDISLRWFYKMSWVELTALPNHLAEFLDQTCGEKNMRLPPLGMIHDGAPNAFTYGHYPSNARIVITRGLLDILDPDELEAVVAHEIGHAKHWDMLLMTAVQLVPLVLYYIYRSQIERESNDDDEGGGNPVIAIGAFILYIVSEYIVLFFSRVREYHADRFAALATGRPSALSSALVKIAYGLAGQEDKKEEKGERRRAGFEAVGALGIFDAGTARAFAVASHVRVTEQFGERALGKEALLGAMRWDLWNPWAKYYELHSTHPLVAKRLHAISELSKSLGQEPLVEFSLRQPESYWDEFFVDLFMFWLPMIAFVGLSAVASYSGQTWLYGMAISVAGLALLVKLNFTYPRKFFPAMRIASLLKKVKVSGVRGVPCTLRGRVIGRGVPGLIWSEDFVIRDETGILFLDYRQPLRVWEFFFGLMRRQSLEDAEVEVTGWFRRAPVPYLEIRTLTTKECTRTCYVYVFQVAFAVLLLIGGLAVAADLSEKGEVLENIWNFVRQLFLILWGLL